MGVFGFVAAGGGSIGVLLGGVLTDALDWHWIFLVNLPIGIAVFVLSLRARSPAAAGQPRGRASTSPAPSPSRSALMLAVYAIVNGNEAGWASAQTLGLLAVAVVLFAAFLVIESRVARRSCRSACSGAATSPRPTSSACSGRRRCSRGSSSPRSTCSWCSTTAPLQVGLAFLPANLIMGAFSVGLSAKLVHALRRPSAARRGAAASPRVGLAAVRPRAGRRQLRHRRPARA